MRVAQVSIKRIRNASTYVQAIYTAPTYQAHDQTVSIVVEDLNLMS